MLQNNLLKIGLWRRLFEDFRLLGALIKDYWKGEYRDVSLASIVVFVLAVVYFLSPIDVLSDFIPILGQVDDALILLFCIYFLEKDLQEYHRWKQDRF
ncbi:MAG: DUF1232 domain-containing protein [Deltaproteobacteria bacterium]|nr:DUF1232 domain-containing protein [Deltaproteobacteria bacterium]